MRRAFRFLSRVCGHLPWGDSGAVHFLIQERSVLGNVKGAVTGPTPRNEIPRTICLQVLMEPKMYKLFLLKWEAMPHVRASQHDCVRHFGQSRQYRFAHNHA